MNAHAHSCWVRRALQALRRGPKARSPATPAGKRRTCPPAVEALEDRTLPSILGPLAGFRPSPLPSDGTGGAAQALTSYDGRFVAYSSTATNAVAGQVNTAVGSNVFLYDRQTRTTTLVSHVPGSATTAADGSSDTPRVSSDGRYVAYESTAPDLVPGQVGPRGQDNVFLYDRTTGTNVLVSGSFDPATDAPSDTVTGNDTSLTGNTTGFGFGPGSGDFLLFSSFAGDLVDGQTGRLVENLFLYDTQLRFTTLVSHAPGGTTGGNDDAVGADLTPDGSTVVFQSLATNLVSGEADEAASNIFLYDTASDTTRLVSGAYDPATAANSPTKGAGFSLEPQISADGGLISFVSDAGDLVPGENATTRNVFLYDNRALVGGVPNHNDGRVSLVSGAHGSPSQAGNGDSVEAVLSSDGSTLAFLSTATDLTNDIYPSQGGGDGAGNAFLFDTATLYAATHPPLLVSFTSDSVGSSFTAAGGVVPTTANGSFLDLSVSGDGSRLAYVSLADNLVTGQTATAGGATGNVFLYDGTLDKNALVSRAHGAPAATGNEDSLFSHLSGDGTTVNFLSGATNVGAGDTGGPLTLADGGQNLFAYDVAAAADPRLVSRSAFQAMTTSLVWGTSADGRFVVFTSDDAHVVPNQDDMNFAPDVFLLDRNTGQVSLVSHTPGSATAAGDAGAPDTVGGGLGTGPVISADGNWVAFVSDDGDLVPNEDTSDGGGDQVFLYDNRPGPTHGTVTLVSHAAGSPAVAGDDSSDDPVLTDDPSGNVAYVAYDSFAVNLVPFFATPFDGEAIDNVYLYDTTTGTSRLLSQDLSNPPAPDAQNPRVGGDAGSFGPSISDGGRFVAYVSRASNLVTQTTFSVNNVYLFDRSTGRTLLVTRSNSSPSLGADDSSFAPVLSADGSTVAFTSFATDLSPGQNTSLATDFTNVFTYNVGTGGIRLVSGSHGSATATADGYSDSPALGADGSRVAFRSDAPDLLPGVTFPTDGSNIFLFDGRAGSVTLLSHKVGSATAPAAGASEAPAIDGAGDLVVYLSRATDLVPGQQEPGVAVNNVFVYAVALGANGLASGQDGSITTPSARPAFQAVISRDPVVAFNLLAASNTSVAQLNSLAELHLAPNTVADGSPPGTVVGTLSVASVFAGQFLQPKYQPLPAGSPFALGGTTGNAVPLVTEFAASAAAQSVYQVLPVVNIGFGFTAAALTVFVGPHPAAPAAAAHPLLPELVFMRVGKKVRLMLEVLDVVTGAVVESLLCPFQSPTYRAITVSPLDITGDGIADLVRVSARKGKHTVTALLPA